MPCGEANRAHQEVDSFLATNQMTSPELFVYSSPLNSLFPLYKRALLRWLYLDLHMAQLHMVEDPELGFFMYLKKSIFVIEMSGSFFALSLQFSSAYTFPTHSLMKNINFLNLKNYKIPSKLPFTSELLDSSLNF